MLLEADNCQLVLVDFQPRLMSAMVEGQAVCANAVRLGQMANLIGVPLAITEQNPARLGESLPELRALVQDGNGHILPKMAFSACAAGLCEHLRPTQHKPQGGGNVRSLPKHLQKAIPPASPERNSVVLAGCEAHVCLLQTALELLEQDFDVWVVTDACSSRSEHSRDAAFDRLAGNGAELVTTEMVAFEWLRSAEHPLFKPMQALIK